MIKDLNTEVIIHPHILIIIPSVCRFSNAITMSFSQHTQVTERHMYLQNVTKVVIIIKCNLITGYRYICHGDKYTPFWSRVSIFWQENPSLLDYNDVIELCH